MGTYPIQRQHPISPPIRTTPVVCPPREVLSWLRQPPNPANGQRTLSPDKGRSRGESEPLPVSLLLRLPLLPLEKRKLPSNCSLTTPAGPGHFFLAEMIIRE